MFFCEYYEIFKNTYFVEHLQSATSANSFFKDLFTIIWNHTIFATILISENILGKHLSFSLYFGKKPQFFSLLEKQKLYAISFSQKVISHVRPRFPQYKIKPGACNFIKIETLTQVFSYEFCGISKNTFYTEYLPTTASASTS